ncbi:LysR substrate-binding domain-containing protein [Aureimonas altamirensis]|uniref:LysR substrate-binding domain-containing protein n=1 Tax=Aureimonas altamirensis TaxID=370622 RepID=UPI003D8126FE
MRRNLPPLNALRVFETVVRCGTTINAASELGVTHGAVSRQIQQLEDWLGRPLFRRVRGRLVLTPIGVTYGTATTAALDLLNSATLETMAHGRKVIKVNTTSSFASEWLLPRLDEFYQANKDVEIWVEESKSIIDLNATDCDLAIRMGQGSWPSVRAEPFMDDRLITVCTPHMARALRSPRDLLNARLLHDDDPYATWPRWLTNVGEHFTCEELRHFSAGSRFASSQLQLRATAAGRGVAVARERLAQGMLDSGALVQPFEHSVSLGIAYWLVTRSKGERSRNVSAFVNWLVACGKRS